jgi:hypothetical protein
VPGAIIAGDPFKGLQPVQTIELMRFRQGAALAAEMEERISW